MIKCTYCNDKLNIYIPDSADSPCREDDKMYCNEICFQKQQIIELKEDIYNLGTFEGQERYKKFAMRNNWPDGWACRKIEKYRIKISKIEKEIQQREKEIEDYCSTP